MREPVIRVGRPWRTDVAKAGKCVQRPPRRRTQRGVGLEEQEQRRTKASPEGGVEEHRIVPLPAGACADDANRIEQASERQQPQPARRNHRPHLLGVPEPRLDVLTVEDVHGPSILRQLVPHVASHHGQPAKRPRLHYDGVAGHSRVRRSRWHGRRWPISARAPPFVAVDRASFVGHASSGSAIKVVSYERAGSRLARTAGRASRAPRRARFAPWYCSWRDDGARARTPRRASVLAGDRALRSPPRKSQRDRAGARDQRVPCPRCPPRATSSSRRSPRGCRATVAAGCSTTRSPPRRRARTGAETPTARTTSAPHAPSAFQLAGSCQKI